MKRFLALALLCSMPALAQNATPVQLATDQAVIHSNATVSSSSSSIVSGLTGRQVDLIVNAKGTFTGSPSLTYCLQEVDPGDRTTVIGSQACGAAITAAATQTVSLPAIGGNLVKVSWTFTGTSITQVYATLRAKPIQAFLASNTLASNTVNATCADPGTGCGAGAQIVTPMAGVFGVSFHLPSSSTLAGTNALKAECSTDDGSTFALSAYFSVPGSPPSQQATVSSGSAYDATIVGWGGCTHIRVRNVSATGSGAAIMRGTAIATQAMVVVGDLTGVKTDLSNWITTSSGLSTATTLTQIVAANGSFSTYIKNWKCSSSAAATTTADQQCTLKYGTGTNCATGTTYVDGCFQPALGGCNGQEIVVPAGKAVCWIHAAAGSKIVTVTYEQK